MKKLIFLSLLTILLGCKKDKPTPISQTDPEGSIFVTVIYNNELIEGATVSTEPETKSDTTDITGSAILSKVPVGGYKVTAVHPDIGTGSASVSVAKDSISDVRINLIRGLIEQPSASIQSPFNNAIFDVDALVTFTGTVSDAKDEADNLQVEWLSSIDGSLSNKKANSDGSATFSTKSLSEGDHIITLKVTDTDENESTDEVNISVKILPKAVELNEIEVSNSGIMLSWSVSEEPQFSSYIITRSTNTYGPFEELKVITDVNETSFLDETPQVGVQYYYQVNVQTNNNLSSFSNIESSIYVGYVVKAVVLDSIINSPDGFTLNWSASEEEKFINYRILKSENAYGNFEVIDLIADVNTTTYFDDKVKFGLNYHYQIIVVIESGEESMSNIESKRFEGDNIDLGVNIVRMIIDNERPFIYGLDQINNSLLFINKETKAVEKTIFVGSSPTDLSINLSNTKMYVANFGSTLIAVIDLDTKEKIDDLTVDPNLGSWEGNPYRIVCLADDKIAYTGEDQWNGVKLIDAKTGAFISSSGSIYQPELVTNKDQTIVYGGECCLSTSTIMRFAFEGENTNVKDENAIDGYARRALCISKDDKYIFYHSRKILAQNLSSIIGSFSENIYACNSDGSIAIGENNIWDANTFSIIKELPISSTIMKLDSNDTTLYIYDNNTSKIYLISI